jgi:hypothetical protein
VASRCGFETAIDVPNCGQEVWVRGHQVREHGVEMRALALDVRYAEKTT